MACNFSVIHFSAPRLLNKPHDDDFAHKIHPNDNIRPRIDFRLSLSAACAASNSCRKMLLVMFMSHTDPIHTSRPPRQPAFWITLARSIIALILGLALILQPDKARPMLVNFIGIFWLVAGVMSLRWGASGEPARRPSVVVGIVGIVAGAMVLARFLLIDLVGLEIIVLRDERRLHVHGDGAHF